MGGRGSKINYETVDRTDPSARAQGERRAQEENEKRMRDLRDQMERDRELALREAEERALYEEESQRMRLDQQRRERKENERRLKEEEAFLQLKYDLMTYDFQICPKTRKESFIGLEVDDIDLIRIALIGPIGSGKTEFIGTLQRALGETEVTAFGQSDGVGTILLDEYYVQRKIRMIDTSGFYESDERLLDECLNIMSGRLRPGEEVVRDCGISNAAANQDPAYQVRGAQPLSRCVHAVVFVFKASDPHLRDGKYKESMRKIREVLRKNGYAPVTVLTHLDRLKDKEDVDEIFREASWATGSSSEEIYFIQNYHRYKAGQSEALDRAALEILDSALFSAERFIRISKQREKNEIERDVVAGDEVPQEIRARGTLALRAYKKALLEGRTCIKRVPIMIIGQDRSGKTSLAKSLKGERFNSEEDSTIGVDVGPSYFKVTTEIWKPGEKDEQQNVERACSYEHHIARLIVQNLSAEESVAKEESLESNQIEHLVQVEPVKTSVSDDTVSTSCARDENMVDSCSQSEEDMYLVPAASDASSTTSHDSVFNPEFEDLPVSLVSISLSRDRTISDQNPAGDIQTVPDDVASFVEVLLREDNDLEREKNIYSVLWDFGGQSVYYTTHSLFLTSRAIYLLVNDLSRHLHHKAKSVMKQGMFEKLQDSFRLKTNADYLDFWMSSVASLAIQDESNSKKTKSDMLPELPAVFLVCTHADKPYDGGDPREMGRMVFGHLQTKPYKNHLHDVFIVDNTKSGCGLECPEVLRLRQEIRAVAKELPHMKEAVPVKWLKFEKHLQAKKDEGIKWIFLEQAKEIAWEVCNVSDDEEFRTLLNFLHDQRVLIHFDDTPELNKMVVLDTQWLINVFKEVITIRPFDSKEKKFQELWSRLEEKGVLEEPLLEHVWGPLYRKEDTCQSLIAIMERFSLLCSWPSSDGSCGKQYLVPSMLMSHPPEEIMELIASAEIPSLFLKFETGQVPPGLFPRLVLQFLQWCKQECTSPKHPKHPQLYHDYVRIYSSDCSVILRCHMSAIEVVVHRDDKGQEGAYRLKSAISSPGNISPDTFACAVLRQLELMLESMRREFCWLQNMKYEVSFLCPVCCHGGVVSYCRTHRIKGCKQEECLHFWPESELCSKKKIIRCTRSAVAKMNRVLVKDFEPWFSTMRSQLTVDKCGDGNLVSVEDVEETFSADEVLQISLTQQRDDQTISPQLKGSLQLEGACPDTPDFDSKSGEMWPNLGKTTATTEICLPDSVQHSLLSASCDAKEIVHQLKENLPLKKDVLERPDHDTKKIIRSLAQKAKDLKRLDVFEHLREIAPAGTTGPLLPENLPVQQMSITKARDLSIRLAGGDEWMELAEGLGLTPPEIRFLDKRTLNPMEAALSFIAKQRFLSVGELYELLNERDFPMLADLL